MAGLGRTHLVLREEDVVKLVCEFLENRAMTISQVSLERESGVINGDLSDDLIFLRQLILDGQWEDCLEFIQPLASLQTFDYNLFNFLILKHKFVELLCIKNEIPLGNTDSAVEEVVKVLKEIEVFTNFGSPPFLITGNHKHQIKAFRPAYIYMAKCSAKDIFVHDKYKYYTWKGEY